MAYEFPLFVEDRPGARPPVLDAPIGQPCGIRKILEGLARSDQLFEGLPIAFADARIDIPHLAEGMPGDVAVIERHQLARLSGVADDAGVLVDLPLELRGDGGEVAEARFACGQIGLNPTHLRHILHRALPEAAAVGHVADGFGDLVDRADFAIGTLDPVFRYGLAGLAMRGIGEKPRHAQAVVGMDELLDIGAHRYSQILRADAEDGGSGLGIFGASAGPVEIARRGPPDPMADLRHALDPAALRLAALAAFLEGGSSCVQPAAQPAEDQEEKAPGHEHEAE